MGCNCLNKEPSTSRTQETVQQFAHKMSASRPLHPNQRGQTAPKGSTASQPFCSAGSQAPSRGNAAAHMPPREARATQTGSIGSAKPPPPPPGFVFLVGGLVAVGVARGAVAFLTAELSWGLGAGGWGPFKPLLLTPALRPQGSRDDRPWGIRPDGTIKAGVPWSMPPAFGCSSQGSELSSVSTDAPMPRKPQRDAMRTRTHCAGHSTSVCAHRLVHGETQADGAAGRGRAHRICTWCCCHAKREDRSLRTARLSPNIVVVPRGRWSGHG